MAEGCKLCNGTNWREVVRIGEPPLVRRCECWTDRQRRHAADVPREFHEATLANYRVMPGNRSAKTLADAFPDSGRDLLFVGGVGSGKTRLACSVLNDFYARQHEGWFQRISWVLYDLQPRPGASPEGAASVERYERRLQTEPVLCLDDLGAERDKASDYTRRMLLMLYERRHDYGLRTLWTSNDDLDALARKQGDDRLASRLAGWSDVAKLTVPDQRVIGRAATP